VGGDDFFDPNSLTYIKAMLPDSWIGWIADELMLIVLARLMSAELT
jgi:hypothetical protein